MVAIVTGAYGVFGVHITEGLLAAGIATICVGRDQAKAEELVAKMRLRFPGTECNSYVCDLSDHDEIKKFAEWMGDTPVEILINNAAVTPKSRTETKHGLEQQWACNVLGYHWMMKEFERNLLLSGKKPARVVNVASFYAGGLDLTDVEFKSRTYDPDQAYRASKQANRMLTNAWAEIWDVDKILVMSCHPGVATSNVSLGLGFDLDRSEEAARNGATTPLYLALDASVTGNHGNYFRDSQPQQCSFAVNDEEVRRLFEIVESYS